jgi:hypothetical protein
LSVLGIASGTPNLESKCPVFLRDFNPKSAGRRLSGRPDCILQPSFPDWFLFAILGVLVIPRLLGMLPQESWHAPCWIRQVNAMKDLLFTLITIGFFAGAWLYTKACEKL